MKKTEADIKCEQIAFEMNGNLIGKSLEVIATNKRGPYNLLIKDLTKKHLDHLLPIILELLS